VVQEPLDQEPSADIVKQEEQPLAIVKQEEKPAAIVKLEDPSKPEEVHVPHVDEAAKEEVKVEV
jgi:hypothetical protein